MDLSSLQFPGLKVLAEVGRGATGVVYRAHDVAMDRLVAMKALIPGPGADRRARSARFIREARILAALMPNDNIPAIHAVMGHQGHHCHVREFVEGKTLKERVDARTITESDAMQRLLVFNPLLTACARWDWFTGICDSKTFWSQQTELQN